jgi:hypothetical protein
MSFGATSPLLSNNAKYPWFMRLPPSDAYPMDMINSYMASQGIKKIGFIGDTSDYCTDNFKYFEGAFNGSVIAKEYYGHAKLTADKADEMHTKMIEKGRLQVLQLTQIYTVTDYCLILSALGS